MSDVAILAERRPGIASKGGTPELRNATVIRENSLIQAISENPVSMAPYSRMQRAGGDLAFNYELGIRFNALAQTSPSARLIELDPAAIQAEARILARQAAQYAAQVFTYEADHLIDMHLGV